MLKNKLEISTLLTVNTCISFLSFIKNNTIKRNTAYNFLYLDYLNQLTKNYQINGSIHTSLLKDQIILLGSILESFIFDFLKENQGKLALPKQWKEVGQSKKYIHIDQKNRVKTVLETEVIEEINERIELAKMIDLANQNKIFGDKYTQAAHLLRDYRNKIHYRSLDELECNYYTLDKLILAKKCIRIFLEHFSKKEKINIQKVFDFLY